MGVGDRRERAREMCETLPSLPCRARVLAAAAHRMVQLPFRLLPPCSRARTDACMPAYTKRNSWRQEPPTTSAPCTLSLPAVPESALRQACGPLQVHVTTAAERAAVTNRSFWSGWLTWDAQESKARSRLCLKRLRAWRPEAPDAFSKITISRNTPHTELTD